MDFRKGLNKRNKCTSKSIDSVLKTVLNSIETTYEKKPYRIIEIWPKVIGEKLSKMTKPVSFKEGVLLVLVKSSTLLNILNMEKQTLLKKLQIACPKQTINQIIFKIQ